MLKAKEPLLITPALVFFFILWRVYLYLLSTLFSLSLVKVNLGFFCQKKSYFKSDILSQLNLAFVIFSVTAGLRFVINPLS